MLDISKFTPGRGAGERCRIIEGSFSINFSPAKKISEIAIISEPREL